MRPTTDTEPAPKRSIGLLLLRYGIGGVMVLAGIVMLIVDPSGLGVDGFGMAAGGGLSVLLINFLYRLGVTGDREREEEEQARVYFDEHGEWPEEQVKVHERKWRLAPGVQTLEEERRRQPGA